MTNKKSVEFDQARSDKFAEKMMAILNYGALNFMISIGYRTGLLDVMGKLPPSTPQTIAKKSNLNERYIREWLGAMFTGGIVEHDHEKNTYLLPPEHAAWLTREATPNNIAVTTQWVSVLGSVEDKIVKCFKDGGGATYEDYNMFHEVMADESNPFIISTPNEGGIEVLGTVFNVGAPNNSEFVEVHVLEGQVALFNRSRKGVREILLSREQACHGSPGKCRRPF